jgi:hypothetical protein
LSGALPCPLAERAPLEARARKLTNAIQLSDVVISGLDFYTLSIDQVCQQRNRMALRKRCGSMTAV